MPLSFTDITPWQNMPSSCKKQTGQGKIWLPCGGNLNICPQLHWPKLPCHSQAELSSLNSLKSRGRDKNPPWHCFPAGLGRECYGDRHYGLSITWEDPSQVRAASMEEAVGKLTACTSSGTNWTYALVQLHEGTHHAPLSEDGHLGILPQRGAGATPEGGSANLRSANSLPPDPKSSTP